MFFINVKMMWYILYFESSILCSRDCIHICCRRRTIAWSIKTRQKILYILQSSTRHQALHHRCPARLELSILFFPDAPFDNSSVIYWRVLKGHMDWSVGFPAAGLAHNIIGAFEFRWILISRKRGVKTNPNSGPLKYHTYNIDFKLTGFLNPMKSWESHWCVPVACGVLFTVAIFVDCWALAHCSRIDATDDTLLFRQPVSKSSRDNEQWFRFHPPQNSHHLWRKWFYFIVSAIKNDTMVSKPISADFSVSHVWYLALLRFRHTTCTIRVHSIWQYQTSRVYKTHLYWGSADSYSRKVWWLLGVPASMLDSDTVTSAPFK